MKRLYLEVDGVLLTRYGQSTSLAAHAGEFLEFALSRFECFWCTRFCAEDQLRRFVPANVVNFMRPVQLAPFSVLKTEAMTGDFYWIDSSPIAAEISDLCRRGALDRWIEINTPRSF